MLSQNVKKSVNHNRSSLNSCPIVVESVCCDKSKLSYLKKILIKKKVLSVALNVMKKGENVKEGIGARILARKSSLSEIEGHFSFGLSVIIGITLYFGGNKVYYLDTRKSGENSFLTNFLSSCICN